MEITINGRKNLVDLENADTLAETIRTIDERVQPLGYRVQGFELDGQEAWPEWEDQVGDRSVEDFDQLDVELMSPRQFCSETLSELQSQFEELETFTDTTIEKLQARDKEEAYKYLQSVMSHLQQYIDTINHVVLVSEIDLTTIQVNDTPVNELAHELRRIVNDSEQAIKDENLEALSDLAGDRLKPLVQQFNNACPLLIEKVRDAWPEPEDLDE